MTNAELTILSLIVEQTRHGYEVEQAIDDRGMRDWTEIGFSSIYYILDRLEKRGWVKSAVEPRPGRGPDRRRYRVTAAGVDAWRAAVYEALSTPLPVRSPFLLGLANLPGLSSEDAREAITIYRERLAERQKYVKCRQEERRGQVPDFVDAMFDLTLTLIQAELNWITHYLTHLEEVTQMPVTTDLAKLHKQAYTARSEPALLTVPDGNFLTIQGRGAPDGDAFGRAVEALYPVGYTLKFQQKAQGQDFKICPLEGLWYGGAEWMAIPREEWAWKLMIRLPDFITEAMMQRAVDEVVRKKRLEAARLLRLEQIDEGLSAQILHTGPYSKEPPTIERLHAFIAVSGYEPEGAHHEIYLSDPKRTAPEKLKTILRQPVRKREA